MTLESSGIFLVDKPPGISSAFAISILKRRFRPQRIGHAGTLDPFASGLLVVLVNSATRLASYAENGEKMYSGEIALGLCTESDDITGTVISRNSVPSSDYCLDELARGFTGEITQVPPRVSALKIEGERAYKLARRGVEFSPQARLVTIHDFSLSRNCPEKLHFKLRCSKGTYVRALARDIGVRLGCGACLASLRREFSFPFEVSDAKLPEELQLADLLPWDILFPTTPRLSVAKKIAGGLLQGNLHALRELDLLAKSFEKSQQLIYQSDDTGRALGVLVREGENWKFGINVDRDT